MELVFPLAQDALGGLIESFRRAQCDMLAYQVRDAVHAVFLFRTRVRISLVSRSLYLF
jgi:hypothetical protein